MQQVKDEAKALGHDHYEVMASDDWGSCPGDIFAARLINKDRQGISRTRKDGSTATPEQYRDSGWAEVAFAQYMGLIPNTTILDHGDDGLDFCIRLAWKDAVLDEGIGVVHTPWRKTLIVYRDADKRDRYKQTQILVSVMGDLGDEVWKIGGWKFMSHMMRLEQGCKTHDYSYGIRSICDWCDLEDARILLDRMRRVSCPTLSPLSGQPVSAAPTYTIC